MSRVSSLTAFFLIMPLAGCDQPSSPSSATPAPAPTPSVAAKPTTDPHEAALKECRPYGTSEAHITACSGVIDQTPADPALTAKALKRRAYAYWSTSRNRLAVEDYTKALTLTPDDIELYLQRGQAHRDGNQFDLSIADFTKAIELKPNAGGGYTGRGVSHEYKRNFDAAIADYTRAIEIDPDVTAFSYRADALKARGEFDRAYADYARAIDLLTQKIDAATAEKSDLPAQKRTFMSYDYRDRGDAYVDSGDHDRAIADYSQSIKLMADDHWSFGRRAASYLAIGKIDHALADYYRAIELSSDDGDHFLGRARTYIARGERERAAPDLSTAIEIYSKDIATYPDDPSGYLGRGEAYRETGEIDRAIADYEAAGANNPSDSQAYRKMAELYAIKGEVDRALQTYNEALDINRGDLEALQGRAKLHQGRGDAAAAAADYERIVSLLAAPRGSDQYRLRALALLKLGKADQALPAAEQALSLRPDSLVALETRGLIFEALGRKEEAIADLKRVLSLSSLLPASRDALIRLGLTQ